MALPSYPQLQTALPAELASLIEDSVERFQAEWPDWMLGSDFFQGRVGQYKAEITRLVLKAYQQGNSDAQKADGEAGA